MQVVFSECNRSSQQGKMISECDAPRSGFVDAGRTRHQINSHSDLGHDRDHPCLPQSQPRPPQSPRQHHSSRKRIYSSKRIQGKLKLPTRPSCKHRSVRTTYSCRRAVLDVIMFSASLWLESEQTLRDQESALIKLGQLYRDEKYACRAYNANTLAKYLSYRVGTRMP